MKHTIALEGLEFFAYHGFFEEEQKIGNKYGVDLSVDTNFDNAAQTDNLEGTINYMDLYDIVNSEMSVSCKLLEHLGQKIVDRIYQKWPKTAFQVTVKIKKYNPPIGGVCYASSINITQ
ncbi:dihydroneopterin aldolase [Flammeovirga sp. EKP202]|uniref:dihydroneopterin aldolase n=1 Tax=Flammeovirga sp. EKP202 TaxID=2770592 RepID=UPI00165F9748|nr:dihydroneopterin aldolase [Flammeovirga sp. EKP202]MBD0404720.1 dihydroneopterin aldolase [Flammeovirga sp. EKP202]